jgi:hypothetical protein
MAGEWRKNVSMKQYTTVMVGYDISALSGYIRELERTNDEWRDGILAYSLNLSPNEIGYEHHTKLVFGAVLCEISDLEGSEEGTLETVLPDYLQSLRKDIWQTYKSFLFDHTKITDRTEPQFGIHFVTYWA